MVAPEVIRANLVVGGDKNLVHKPFTVAGTEVRRGPPYQLVRPRYRRLLMMPFKRLDGVEKSAAKPKRLWSCDSLELRHAWLMSIQR